MERLPVVGVDLGHEHVGAGEGLLPLVLVQQVDEDQQGKVHVHLQTHIYSCRSGTIPHLNSCTKHKYGPTLLLFEQTFSVSFMRSSYFYL